MPTANSAVQAGCIAKHSRTSGQAGECEASSWGLLHAGLTAGTTLVLEGGGIFVVTYQRRAAEDQNQPVIQRHRQMVSLHRRQQRRLTKMLDRAIFSVARMREMLAWSLYLPVYSIQSVVVRQAIRGCSAQAGRQHADRTHDHAVSMPVPPAFSQGASPTSGEEPQQVPRLTFGTARKI